MSEDLHTSCSVFGALPFIISVQLSTKEVKCLIICCVHLRVTAGCLINTWIQVRAKKNGKEGNVHVCVQREQESGRARVQKRKERER